MKTIRVAAASVNQTPLDWAGNKRRILAAIAEAKKNDCFLVVLPELAVSGYGVEDHFFSEDVLSKSLAMVNELADEASGIVALVGFPFAFRKNVFNGVALLAGGKVQGIGVKNAMAGDGIHYEPRWFKSWPLGVAETLPPSDELPYPVPVGDLYFDLAGVKVGLEICEDAWVARRRGVELASLVDIIANPSASHFAFGKHAVREKFVLDGSRRFGVCYIYANLLGNEAGRAVFDGGNMVASRGRLLASGQRLSFKEVVVDFADVDLHSAKAMYQRAFANAAFPAEAMTSANTGEDGPKLVSLSHSTLRFGTEQAPFTGNPPGLVGKRMGERAPLAPAPSAPQLTKEEEFVRAGALGLFDYMRKARSNGFTISLSGGADSATVAALAALSWRLALDELGPKELAQRLAYAPKLSSLLALEHTGDFAAAILTCVYQKTENNSAETLATARDLAGELSAKFFEFDVGPLVAAYQEMVGKATGETLTWAAAAGDAIKDAALQNLQARVRVPGVWMLANLSNTLLLTTGNRSEIAVGYTTMDGDSAGSFNPIGGVPKRFIRTWLSWMAKEGVLMTQGFRLKLAALGRIARLQPSAELKPLADTQTDEKDLMPYDLLDDIEGLMVHEKKSPREVFFVLEPRWAGLLSGQGGGPDSAGEQTLQAGRERLVTYIERFARLFSRNQWKRERFAPALHLDDRNLDPRSWCRFPILSSGFAEELEELKGLLRVGPPKKS